MDTIADDGFCRNAGRGMRATFTMRASARPRYAPCGLKYPLFSGHARSAPERPVLNVSKDDPRRTFSHRPFKTDWSLPARAKAPETGHREGRSWVDFGRKPGVPSVRLLTTSLRRRCRGN
jgi:hypothetical protein